MYIHIYIYVGCRAGPRVMCFKPLCFAPCASAVARIRLDGWGAELCRGSWGFTISDCKTAVCLKVFQLWAAGLALKLEFRM